MNKLEKLINKVNEVISDEKLTWEQKNNIIFFDGLKKEIEKEISDENFEDINSSNKEECLNFQSWLNDTFKTIKGQ